MIRVDNLSKHFGSFRAVDGISFCVEQGEIFGLLGPNGAGKSTTIRMLTGLTYPSSGHASINGLDCSTQRHAIHRLIGVVFELPTLYERLSVRENLLLFTRLFEVSESRLQEVMARLALDEVQQKWAGRLSKGWKQRVLIARAILHKPKVLFLDEPTSGLDPNSAIMIREIIQELRRDGTTIVLCTHDMQEADQLCDRIGFVYKGKLAALNTPQALKAEDQQKELVVEYLNDGQVLRASYPLDAPETAELIQRKLLAKEILTINTKQHTLADVFARVTGGELS